MAFVRLSHILPGLLSILAAGSCAHPDISSPTTLTPKKAPPRVLTPSEKEIEAHINDLVNVSRPGYGYSGTMTGRTFLPLPGTDKVSMGLMGGMGAHKSDRLKALVEKGAAAVPLLLEHLDDDRPTKIAAMKALMWMRFPDEYDYNRRARGKPPRGVNRDSSEDTIHPAPYSITVGDLCLVALGQIVNRRFTAVRYQPTGGLVVSSPTYSFLLERRIRADWSDLTEETHREGLERDLLEADTEERRIGAYRRLAFYYPKTVDRSVVKHLAKPLYDQGAVLDTYHALVTEPSPENRKKRFDAFCGQEGELAKQGLLYFLLDEQATRERGLGDDLHEVKEDFWGQGRPILVELFGYPEKVSTSDLYGVREGLGTLEQARFIEALKHDRSKAIDEAIHSVLRTTSDDTLAYACMKRLVGRGYDDTILEYCRRRIPKAASGNKWKLELMLRKLTK